MMTSLNWNLDLMQALPDLLMELVKRGSPQSLERLQLVSLEIKQREIDNAKKATHFQNKVLSLPKHSQDFLTISGDLDVLGKVLEVKLNYFSRGERKFLKTTIETPSPMVSHELGAFSALDIENFYSKLSKSNNFFFDQKLAELNGRPVLQLPSQMLLSMILEESSKVTDKSFEHIIIKFHETVSVGEALLFSYARKQGNFFSSITADNKSSITLDMSPLFD